MKKPSTKPGLTAPAAPEQPTDHIERDCILELPYLDAGRRVFVATDEKGWLIAHAMGLSDSECRRIIDRLNDELEAYRIRPRLHLMA